MNLFEYKAACVQGEVKITLDYLDESYLIIQFLKCRESFLAGVRERDVTSEVELEKGNVGCF